MVLAGAQSRQQVELVVSRPLPGCVLLLAELRSLMDEKALLEGAMSDL